MENERRFYVYMYLNIDDIPVYIGKGTDQRKRNHLRCAKNTIKNSQLDKIIYKGIEVLRYKYL